jgi:hypothetical protein
MSIRSSIVRALRTLAALSLLTVAGALLARRRLIALG